MACACSTGWWPIPTNSGILVRCRRSLVIAAALALCVATDGAAQNRRSDTRRLDLDGRSLTFRTLAGAIALRNDAGRIDCEAGTLAFLVDAERPRPVTFVIGGGPGTSSAYLNLGAVGPWRIDFNGAAPRVDALVSNAQSWLDFTDLVFVDPPGTGQGRLLTRDAKAKERVWSVDGDIDLLSDAIAIWLRRHDRLAAPKAILAQSYGGFRAPRIAEALHRRHGVALKALILVSPILDYGWRYHARSSPLSFASLLPSFAAARMESEGAFDADKLREVEDYARGAFIEDYLRGLRDAGAVARLIDRVGAITGLPRDTVDAARGRVDEKLFGREVARKAGKLTSLYDAAVTGDDPDPAAPQPDHADPFLGALKAPLTVAMAQMLPAAPARRAIVYNVANETVFQQWRWNADHGLPEAVTALRKTLALDAGLRVFVAHGYSDLQTPYFESRLILDQLPDFGAGRVLQKNYRGGHMFYSRDDSRAAFRADIRSFLADLTERK